MNDGEYSVPSSIVLSVVNRSTCSAYDGEFVALAQQLGVILATQDKKILSEFPDIAKPLSELVAMISIF